MKLTHFLSILGGVLMVVPGFSLAHGQQSLIPSPVADSAYLINLNTQARTLSERLKQNPNLEAETSLKTILEDRRREMLKLAATSAKKFLALTLTDRDLTRIPLLLQSKVEQEKTVRGIITVVHEDTLTPTGDFDDAGSRYNYFVGTETQNLSLYPTSFLPFRSGAEIMVSGYQLGSVMVTDTEEPAQNLQVLQDAPAPTIVGDQRTLVVLVDFLDSGPRPWTPEEAAELVFGGEFPDFYQEQSYGQISFSGDVVGWYTLPRNAVLNDACAPPDSLEIQNFLSAIDLGVDPGLYNQLVIFASHSSCLGGGWSSVGSTSLEINGSYYQLSLAFVGYNQLVGSNWVVALEHEMGHSLGLWHAHSWRCEQGEVLYGVCEASEYGNPLDIMGSGGGRDIKHFNSFYKYFLGWLGGEDSQTISQSGRYTIRPLESEEGIRLFKIQPPGVQQPIFSIENRQPIGFDSGLNSPQFIGNANGIIINHIIPPTGQAVVPVTNLLDLSPALTPDEFSLRPGAGVFTDELNNITIGPVISADENGATFDVAIGPACLGIVALTNPGFNGIASIGFSSPSQSTFQLHQNSTCPASSYLTTVSNAPDGLSFAFNPSLFSLAPGQLLQQSLVVNASITTVPGEYVVPVIFRNTVNGATQIKQIIVRAMASPVITSFSPSSGVFGTNMHINGLGFLVGPPGNKIVWSQSDEPRVSWVAFSPNGQTLDFPVPNIPAGQYDIRIAADSPYTYGAAANFNVLPVPNGQPITINVLSPNGGESFHLNQTIPVQWLAPNILPASSMAIILKGSSGLTIAVASSTNDGLEVIPTPTNTGSYQVVVEALSNNQTFIDQSDNSFEVLSYLPPLSLWISEPMDDQEWLTGSSQSVSWVTDNGLPTATISIKLRKTGGTTYDVVDDIADDGQENITVPLSLPPGYYRVIVEVISGDQTFSAQGWGLITISSSPFVDPFSITVTNPNGGEKLIRGSGYQIRWQKIGGGAGGETFDLTVRDYQTNYVYTVASGVGGNQYSWIVGQGANGTTIPNGSYYLRVCQSGGTSVCDESNQVFTIYSTRPRGGSGGDNSITPPTPVDNPGPDLTASIFDSIKLFFRALVD